MQRVVVAWFCRNLCPGDYIEYRVPILSHHLSGWRLGRIARAQLASRAEGERRFIVQDEDISSSDAGTAPKLVSVPLLYRGSYRSPLPIPEVLVRCARRDCCRQMMVKINHNIDDFHELISS